MVPGTTCRRRTALRAALSASRPFSASAGILAKAVLDGANTVNGPGAASVSTSPAAETAASSVENSGVPATRSTMDGCWTCRRAEEGPNGGAAAPWSWACSCACAWSWWWWWPPGPSARVTANNAAKAAAAGIHLLFMMCGRGGADWTVGCLWREDIL